MSDSYLVPAVAWPIRGIVRPPGSKSLTNRALMLAALARGVSILRGVLDSRDTRVMMESLVRLGVRVRHDPAACTAEVTGCDGRPPASAAELWLENSGTNMRFLTALCTLGRGRYRLDGSPRMRERPIGQLVEALGRLGARVVCEAGNDCPPVRVEADGLPGGTATVSGDISSQFLSALLMAAPCARGPVELCIDGELVSKPYIEMTLAVMREFGAEVQRQDSDRFAIAPQSYRALEYAVEPDASAASYFFAAAAITGGEVTVPGLGRGALQGDVAFVDVLERMGCSVRWEADAITVVGGPLRGVDADMNAISDTAQTLAAIAPFASGPTRIRNVAHMRHKETDRISAVATELRRLGIVVEEHADGLTIRPGQMHAATIATYDDHRMAMSFALVGLKVPGVRIADPGCTGKTYPNYFTDLERLCSPPVCR